MSKTKAIIVPEDVEYNPETKSLVVTKPKPLELTYAQAKKLMKQLRPPPSEAKIQQGKRLAESVRKRWERVKEEKKRQELEANDILQRQKLLNENTEIKDIKKIIPNELISIKPKKQYKPRVKKQFINNVPNNDADNEESEEEIIEEVIYKKPKKKVIKKIIHEDDDNDDDDDDDGNIQKVKKATKTIETLNKLDQAIGQLKTLNPYASAFSKLIR